MSATGRLRRGIVAVGAGVILAFIASTAYDAWRLHQQVTQATTRELGNLARALSEEAERSLQAVDLLLTDTALWYQAAGSQLSNAEIEPALRARATATPQVSILTLTDAKGQQQVRSRPTGQPLANVADRPYFTRQRDSRHLGLFINPPVVTRSDRRPGLIVSRRLETPGGQFAGVVSAVVTLDELREVYDAIDLGAGSALLLTFDDGSLLVRQPPDPRSENRVFPELAAGQPTTARLMMSPVDGREKFIVSMPVSDRPLVMSVTRDAYNAFAPWRAEMWGLTGRTIALVLVGLMTIWLLLRQLRRLELGEAALRRSEQRYEQAMAAANEGHAEWNLENHRLFASERWRRLHELPETRGASSAAELLRQIELHPDDLAAGREVLQQHLSGQLPEVDVEYRVKRRSADGTSDAEPGWRWIHMRGRALRDERGVATRFFCAATDISARKADEAERGRLQDQLRQAQHMESLGTLAGGIAHDFNNILGAILGHGEMAQRRAGDDPALQRHLERVMQAGSRAKLLVRRILDFSRSGVRDRGLVQVDRAVEDALLLLSPTLPTHIQLETVLSHCNAAVIGDALQIHQLVSNLCSNAVGAMAEEGQLRVSVNCTRLEQPRHLSHGQVQAGDHVCIEVQDQGSGIPPEVYARMFDPFFSTKKVGEGTGLGLSVVHSIVADMGGAIDVQSAPGQGTRFTLWLPRAADAGPVRPTGDAPPPQGRGQTVLVVDDEAPLVEFAEELLAELGYEPVGFTSSTEALAAFAKAPQRFDLVLTDETMPELSGVELTRQLLALRPDLPVLAMSGYGGEELEQRVAQAGARALVRKPLSARELACAVATLLGEPVPGAVSAET
ncbi:MAG: response regulator [Roseateles sp.]|nr:MAG: response regulator [Roseateles sp.]